MKKILIVLFVSLAVQLTAQNDCENSSFLLEPNQTYVISAWAHEELTTQVKNYSGPRISIEFDVSNIPQPPINFLTSGPIIDGWQRIEGTFIVPDNVSLFELKLHSKGTACYYDDIRIFPYNGNLKSFVYDPVTQRLMAELDENNYATFYEYDKEGGLVRVKKETERGVYTIQESRSSSSTLSRQ